jgi:hypothetical protein
VRIHGRGDQSDPLFSVSQAAGEHRERLLKLNNGVVEIVGMRRLGCSFKIRIAARSARRKSEVRRTGEKF